MERAMGVAGLLLLALSGCADVQVRKVVGGKSEGIKGFRYNLPRPYVLLRQPILVRSTSRVEILPPGSYPQGLPQGASLGDAGRPRGVPLAGAIEVVFLPDCKEQYAIQPRCVCACGQYKMVLRDGWQLLDVNGKFDSTTVASEVLQTVNSVVAAAQATIVPLSLAHSGGGKQKTSPQSPAPGESKNAGMKNLAGEKKQGMLVEIREDDIIPPGLYRVNKPWEKASEPVDGGADLLTCLGLRHERHTTITPIRSSTALQSLGRERHE